jgi:hypothetical protein
MSKHRKTIRQNGAPAAQDRADHQTRVRWPGCRLSDITNLTRAKDAITCFIETEERRQRGRHSPSDGRLCVKTDSWGKGPAAE